MVNRAATSVLFGFEFQTNAAIFIMLDNIKEMNSIRLEGEEDIHINLNDGKYIFAQAKSIVKASSDFSNVEKNLKKAITSLSDAYGKHKDNIKQLIYITNTPNPIKIESEKHIFQGRPSFRKFRYLPPKSQQRIDKLMPNTVDRDIFVIQTLPFETDIDRERYKFIFESIIEFISKLSLQGYISSEDLHNIWSREIFKSGTRKDDTLTISKKEIIWPIIVMSLDNNIACVDLDDSEYQELSRSYKMLIDTCSEKYEFMTRVLSDYSIFKKAEKNAKRMELFVETEYKKFDYIFSDSNISLSEDLKEKLLKIIVSKILSKRIQIDNIKNAVKL